MSSLPSDHHDAVPSSSSEDVSQLPYVLQSIMPSEADEQQHELEHEQQQDNDDFLSLLDILSSSLSVAPVPSKQPRKTVLVSSDKVGVGASFDITCSASNSEAQPAKPPPLVLSPSSAASADKNSAQAFFNKLPSTNSVLSASYTSLISEQALSGHEIGDSSLYLQLKQALYLHSLIMAHGKPDAASSSASDDSPLSLFSHFLHPGTCIVAPSLPQLYSSSAFAASAKAINKLFWDISSSAHQQLDQECEAYQQVNHNLELSKKLFHLHLNQLDAHPVYNELEFQSSQEYSKYFQVANNHINEIIKFLNDCIDKDESVASSSSSGARPSISTSSVGPSKSAGKKSSGFCCCFSSQQDEADVPMHTSQTQAQAQSRRGSANNNQPPYQLVQRYQTSNTNFYSNIKQLIERILKIDVKDVSIDNNDASPQSPVSPSQIKLQDSFPLLSTPSSSSLQLLSIYSNMFFVAPHYVLLQLAQAMLARGARGVEYLEFIRKLIEQIGQLFIKTKSGFLGTNNNNTNSNHDAYSFPFSNADRLLWSTTLSRASSLAIALLQRYHRIERDEITEVIRLQLTCARHFNEIGMSSLAIPTIIERALTHRYMQFVDVCSDAHGIINVPRGASPSVTAAVPAADADAANSPNSGVWTLGQLSMIVQMVSKEVREELLREDSLLDAIESEQKQNEKLNNKQKIDDYKFIDHILPLYQSMLLRDVDFVVRQLNVLDLKKLKKLMSADNDLSEYFFTIFQLYTSLSDFMLFLLREVDEKLLSNTPLEQMFAPFLSSWLEYVRSNISQSELKKMITSEQFTPIDINSNVRHSSSVSDLFRSFLPVAQNVQIGGEVGAKQFVSATSSIISTYIKLLHGEILVFLEKEKAKKMLWGIKVEKTSNNTGDIQLSIIPSVFTRVNCIYACHSQLVELYKHMKVDIKSHDEDKKSYDGRVADVYAGSPITPSASAAPTVPEAAEDALPTGVTSLLDYQLGTKFLRQALDDVAQRISQGMNLFLSTTINSLVWKEPSEEWTSHRTTDEMKQLIHYLTVHFNYMKTHLYDWLFNRILFFVSCDLSLMLEKELVHPRAQLYKNRLATSQVHRLVQIHVMLFQWLENNYPLTPEDAAELQRAHTTRLQAVEDLLTGPTDVLIREFDKLDVKVDDANIKAGFAQQEMYRLNHAPYLSRRQLAGIIKYRQEFENDNEPNTKKFVKDHKEGFFSSNFFC